MYLPDMYQMCSLQELWINNTREGVGCAVVSRLFTVS